MASSSDPFIGNGLNSQAYFGPYEVSRGAPSISKSAGDPVLLALTVAVSIFIVLFVLLAFVVRFLLVVITVESNSMDPTLKHGDRILVVRHWPFRKFKKGQVVLVWPWIMPDSAPKPSAGTGPFPITPYIKRIVGVPGDVITTSISELTEYHQHRELSSHDRGGMRTWYIPPAHYFLRGDNPIGGFDSLTWGPIPGKSVLGVVVKKLSY